MLDQLAVFNHESPGYKSQVSFNGWRVAILNSVDKYRRENVSYFDRHMETDEVFVLLEGKCQLLIAGRGDRPKDTKSVWLVSGLVYNVRQGTWHTQILEENTRVLIVENADTSSKNTEQYHFPQTERIALIP